MRRNFSNTPTLLKNHTYRQYLISKRTKKSPKEWWIWYILGLGQVFLTWTNTTTILPYFYSSGINGEETPVDRPLREISRSDKSAHHLLTQKGLVACVKQNNLQCRPLNYLPEYLFNHLNRNSLRVELVLVWLHHHDLYLPGYSTHHEITRCLRYTFSFNSIRVATFKK